MTIANSLRLPVLKIVLKPACLLTIVAALFPHCLLGHDRVTQPLDTLLDWKRKVDSLDTYSCRLLMRERVNGELTKTVEVRMKVRSQPASLYISSPYQTEMLFVEGRHQGKMCMCAGGCFPISLRIEPKGRLAMIGRRNAMTELGIADCFERYMKEMADQPDYQIQRRSAAQIDGRQCLVTEISYTSPQAHANIHRMRVSYDVKLKLPVRFETHGWTTPQRSKSHLLEEYTFVNVNPKARLSDLDFDETNPQYGFSRKRDKRVAPVHVQPSREYRVPSRDGRRAPKCCRWLRLR